MIIFTLNILFELLLTFQYLHIHSTNPNGSYDFSFLSAALRRPEFIRYFTHGESKSNDQKSLLLNVDGVVQQQLAYVTICEKHNFIRDYVVKLTMLVIQERFAAVEGQVCFLTHLGLIFFYIRSHNGLDKLQHVVKTATLAAFFFQYLYWMLS